MNDNLENKITFSGWLNRLYAQNYVHNNREKYIILIALTLRKMP